MPSSRNGTSGSLDAPFSMTLQSTLEVALAAVAHGRRLAWDAYSGRDLRATEKSANDWVSELDLLVDRAISDRLRSSQPNVVLVSEEQECPCGPLPPSYWILDPIDGTRNAILGIPYFAISLAYIEQGQVLVAVTCNVATGDLYHARRGHGFWHNGARIAQPARDTPLESAVVSTGFPHDKTLRVPHVRLVEWLVTHCSDIRRCASPTLDICHLAMGKWHGVVEMLRPWDFAAGLLFLEEQGISHNVQMPLRAEHFDPRFYFVAGSRHVFPALRSAVLALTRDA
jgi:myo-inositol-1(or 4)-monophosphatase